MRRWQLLSVFVLLLVAEAQAACDPQKELSKCFQRFGLNRMAVLRDGLGVGAVVLAKGGTAIYGDNVANYVTGQAQVEWTQIAADYTSDFNAALASCTTEKVFAPEVALSVVDAILPVKLTGKLKLTSKVSVDQIDGKGSRIPIPEINKYLVSASSVLFRQEMRQFQGAGVKTFLAYEVISAKKLRLSAEGGQDIGGGVEVKATSVLSEGKFSVQVTRTNKSTLELDTDRYYVTAIRTGELVAGKTTASVAFRPLDFKVPGGTVKAVADSTFSAIVTAEGEPLLISDAPRALLMGGPKQ